MEGTSNKVSTASQGDQTITDIQRSVHSSKFGYARNYLTNIFHTELKVKNGSIPHSSDENCDTVEDTAKDVTEGTVARGEVSWSQHCMSGITLCFKVE